MKTARFAMRAGVLLLGLIALAGVATSQAVGGSWAEIGDAGDLPANAQEPAGSGALKSISGTIASATDEDMYRICLTGGGTFSATTNPAAPGAKVDPQLFLFDSGGFGVYANDDKVLFGPTQAALPSGHALTPAAAGVYYLAISSFNNDPHSAGGAIFNEDAADPGPSGPVGTGGAQPVSTWTNNGFTGVPYPATYTLTLTGAVFCPPPAPPGEEQIFRITAGKLSQPADRIDVAFGKPGQAQKVFSVEAFSADAIKKGEFCFGEGSPTAHLKDVNPDPALANHEVWSIIFFSFNFNGANKCVTSGEDVAVIARPVNNENHLVIKEAVFYNTRGTPELEDDIRVGAGTAKKIDLGKFPRFQNLWLCADPVVSEFSDNCNFAAIFQVIGQPIKSPDPKCPTIVADPVACPRQELGAFEFEIRFDAKFVDVELIGLPFDRNEGGNNTNLNGHPACFTNQGEGFVQLACVSTGKDHPIESPNALAVAVVRPKPDVFSLLIANQENGIATQLINQGCNLADLQGHPIPVEGLDVCQDGAITIRYLEGDIHADCLIDVLDQQQISFRWGSRLGNLLYNQRLDLEPSQPKKGDGDIDAKDLQMVYGRHGSTCHDPHPQQLPVDPKAKPPLPPTPTPVV